MNQVQKPPRRHHHVWQHYLRSWSSNGSIYCLQDGRIFPTGTAVVAVEKDFYKLPELTPNDELMLRGFASKAHPAARRNFDEFIFRVMSPLRLADRVGRGMPQSNALLNDYKLHVLERVHAGVESQFIPLLDLSLKGDLSFYDDERCLIFFFYITRQYMRTKGVKERYLLSNKQYGGPDMGHVWNVLSLFCADQLGGSLYAERKERKLVFLRNETKTSFIAGDQPVINLKANGAETVSLSFYYPLSPSSALWLGDVGEGCPYEGGSISEEEVQTLNKSVFEESFKQVFSCEREELIIFT